MAYQVARRVGRRFLRRAAGQVATYAGRYVGRKVRNYVAKKRSFTSSRKSVKRRRVGARKSRSMLAVYDGSGGSHSFCRHNIKGRKGPLRGLAKQTNKNVYAYTTTQRMTSAVGAQGIYIPNLIFTGPILTTVLELLASSVGAGYKSSKCLIHSGYTESKFTNQEKGNVELVLYDIIPKRDISNAALAGNYDVLSSWNVGLNDVTYANNAGSASTPGKSNLGSTPFDSVLFCQYYTVIKKTKVMMSQGSSHIHRVRTVWNGMLDHSFSEAYTYLRGKTIITLAVINGMPLNDQTTKTNIAVGVATVDVVTNSRIVYQGYLNNNFTYDFSDGQQSVTTPYLMDEGSGEAEADVAA